MEGRIPSLQKKRADLSKADPRREFQAFLVRLTLAPGAVFQSADGRKSLTALGKAAARVWSNLESGEGLRGDAAFFRGGEMQGLLFVQGPADGRKIATALRLIKARIARAAEKGGLPSIAWKRAYQTKALVTSLEVAAVLRSLGREKAQAISG